MIEGHPEKEDIKFAVESLPYLGDSVVLSDRDALALMHEIRERLPDLDEEIKEQTDRLLDELEAELEMSEGDEVIINDTILRGIVKRTAKHIAAQVLFNTGRTAGEIREMRQHFQLETPPNSAA